jgi:hypothetical protein
MLGMSTSESDPRVVGVRIVEDRVLLELDDGGTASADIRAFPILSAGTDEERSRFEIIHDGLAVRWPLLDEDISVFSILHPEDCIPMRPEAVERHLEKVRRWRARRERMRAS